MTPDQEAALRELAHRELARRELARRELAATRLPLPRASAVPVAFAPPQDVEAEARAVVKEAAEAEAILRGPFLSPGVSVLEAGARDEARAQREQDRKRQRVTMPGVEGPVDVSQDGIFRPSRVKTVETFEPVAVEGAGVLREEPQAEVIAEADLPAPFDPLTMRPTVQRMYQDPETGTYRQPTLSQEFREAFALQTERGEEALRARQAELLKEQKELDAALAAGEPVPFYSRYVGSALSGILTRPDQGAGMVETELGSALRSVMSWGSAAAAEGYFRGLGYEVDANGQPVDPNDFGYEVAKLRERVGLPAVVTPFGGLSPAAAYYGKAAGMSEDSISTLRNALDSIPQLAGPLPGVATESQTRKVTTFDPEGRRRVEDIPVPDLFENPGGFVEAEARRITQNVAKGRTWGDEYLDTPAVREYYAAATGNPDHAFIAGMIPEIVIPGPEVLLSAPGYATGALSDMLRTARNLRPLRNAERAVDATRQAVKVAKADGRSAGELVYLQDTADEAVRKYADLTDAAHDYDPTLLRRVTEKAADKVFGAGTDKAIAVNAAVRGHNGPQTFREVVETLKRIQIPSEDVAKVATLTRRNLPGDFVSLTDTIAVPRRELAGAKKALAEHRGALFVKGTGEILDELYELARKMPEGPAKQQVMKTYSTARGVLDKSTTSGRGYGGMSGGVRKQVRNAVRAAARETGQADPVDFARRFDQRAPKDVPLGDTPLARELARADSWDDVDPTLRRQAVDFYDLQYPEKFAKSARRTRDVTRAQMFFQSAEQGLSSVLRSRVFDSPRMRRFLARFGKSQTETKAIADIAREIQLAGRTSLRELRAKLLAGVARHGNMDDAVDDLLQSEVSQAGGSPQQAWSVLWGSLYGDALKDNLLETVLRDGSLRLDDAGNIADFPTVGKARAIDRLYSDLDGLLPGITPDLADVAERRGLGGVVTPNFTNAMLKVLFEEGTRKNIAKSKRLTGAGQTAMSDGGEGVNSRYFKRWFGGSKIVDEAGKPMKVHHGTSYQIESFGGAPGDGWLGTGHYFTQRRGQADYYANVSSVKTGKPPHIIDVYLRSNAPLIVDHLIDEHMSVTVAKRLGLDVTAGRPTGDTIRDAAIAQGFDSIILRTPDNAFDPKSAKQMEEIVVFDSKQIKIADSLSQGAMDEAAFQADFVSVGTGTLPERLQAMLPLPSRGVVLSPDAAPMLGNRVQVYDRAAGYAEQMLAEGAESLVSGLEDIPVRPRADVMRMAADAADFAFATGRRNFMQRIQYGYIVPNLPVQVGRVLQMGIVPLVTIGARNALGAFDRAGQKALAALTRRRVLGGGITDPSGVYYSPKTLDGMANEYGLGITQLESERVGSLASDLQRDARKAARLSDDPDNADLIEVLDEGNPFARGFFLRTAEAVELNLRKSVFEMALARGDAPQDAAELARRSQLDYQEVPDAVRSWLGRYVGQSAFIYRAGVEGLAALVENPQAAGATLRAMRAKVEVQDPYSIHGDKALKSLGIVPKGGDEAFYLPEMPFLVPVEAALGTLRAADKLVDDLRFATEQTNAVAGALEGVGPSAEAALRAGGEVVAPAVLAAYDRMKGGEEYQTAGVPDAAPMSDEKAFWAWMLIAHNRDPQHDTGTWAAFTSLAPSDMVEPPEGMESDTVPGAWKQQPPEGVPHVLWDVVDGEPVYFVAEPSDQALQTIAVARALDVVDLDRALPFWALLNEQEGRTPPLSIYTEGALPDTMAEAALESVLPAVDVDVDRALERQAAAVRDIREATAID